MNLKIMVIVAMIQQVAEMPPSIVGSWCLALDRFGSESTYFYRRCEGREPDVIVSPGGFDANETGCSLDAIKQSSRREWRATFHCHGAGVAWYEDDVIRVADGWSLKIELRGVRKIGDPIRYCLVTGACSCTLLN
jgi:hypothetical protein